MGACASRLPSPTSLCILFIRLSVLMLGEHFQDLPQAGPVLGAEGPVGNGVSFLRIVPSDTQRPMLRRTFKILPHAYLRRLQTTQIDCKSELHYNFNFYCSFIHPSNIYRACITRQDLL